jgi:hypothetical protein
LIETGLKKLDIKKIASQPVAAMAGCSGVAGHWRPTSGLTNAAEMPFSRLTSHVNPEKEAHSL